MYAIANTATAAFSLAPGFHLEADAIVPSLYHFIMQAGGFLVDCGKDFRQDDSSVLSIWLLRAREINDVRCLQVLERTAEATAGSLSRHGPPSGASPFFILMYEVP